MRSVQVKILCFFFYRSGMDHWITGTFSTDPDRCERNALTDEPNNRLGNRWFMLKGHSWARYKVFKPCWFLSYSFNFGKWLFTYRFFVRIFLLEHCFCLACGAYLGRIHMLPSHVNTPNFTISPSFLPTHTHAHTPISQ